MNFKKFVKSLGLSGVVYERNGERWLASSSVIMRIPDILPSVTCIDIKPMPEPFEEIIRRMGIPSVSAHLSEALMPFPDGGISDCIRVFSGDTTVSTIQISNADWSLLEKSDFCEIYYSLDTWEDKALLVKNYPENPSDDDVLVGIILPVVTRYSKEERNDG